MIKAIILLILLILPFEILADTIIFKLINQDQGATGFYLYQRIEGQAYNYDRPVIPKGFKDAKIPIDIEQIEIENLTVDTDTKLTYYWVLRVFNDLAISSNSNEVSYTIYIPGNLKLKIEN